MLTGTSENAFNAGRTQCRNQITRQPERYGLGRRQAFALLKCNTKIDVYQFGRFYVDQNVCNVPVADAQDIADDRSSGQTVRIGQTSLEPYARIVEIFEKEVLKHGLEVRTNVLVDFVAFVETFCVSEEEGEALKNPIVEKLYLLTSVNNR